MNSLLTDKSQKEILILANEWRVKSYSPVFFKQKIIEHRATAFEKFNKGEDVAKLVLEFSDFIDNILICMWQHADLDKFEKLSLIAVGGYGRRELHPQSDVDILILKKNDRFRQADDAISKFITQLWDLGLEIGSSVRSIKDCFREAKDDITIATNIMEARTLCGEDSLLEKMKYETRPRKIWSSVDFFIAKRQEQDLRHKKHNNTEYNLEPDLKEAPGGLRDIQMISWVAKRHYNCDSLYALVEHGFLREEEFQSLSECQNFLWRLRFAMHCLLERPENKLLFDHQKMLAKHFGYEDSETSLGIEQLMKKYYLAAVEVSELNDMLLQHFDDEIVHKWRLKRVTPINKRFKLRKGYLETTSDDVFALRPSALIEVFVIAAQHKDVEDIHINTIRQIRKYRHLIDDNFRNDIRNTSLFVELLNSPYKLFTQFKRMKRYGVLGAYIPEFEKIIGQMQYDLFHIYTVDAHTLLLIKFLRRFRFKEYQEKFSIAHNIINGLPKLAPLYIAAIFHDIGKGSGRDHSELGAELVIPFMHRHGFGEFDTELVSWLVKSHLIMSMTTQRKDLADPEVIHEFAEYVGSQVRLDYLYVLTVADVNATNPTLWNGWKASLFRELYTKTKQLFRSGAMIIDNEALIADRKSDASSVLFSHAIAIEDCNTLWNSLDDEYFIRHNGLEIAWQSDLIITHTQGNNPSAPLVAVRTEEKKHLEQTQIFTYTPDNRGLFATTVTILSQLNLSVVDARIMSTNTGMALNTYVVLGEGSFDNPEVDRHQEIIDLLTKNLSDPKIFSEIVKNGGNKIMPRRLKQFEVKTQANINHPEYQNYSIVEIKTLDRPGLLASIGAIFMGFDLVLHNARISTLGESVEDFFSISTPDNKPITDPEFCNKLIQSIESILDQQFIASSEGTLAKVTSI
jgi:[protein-PII] uridylyltransferase